MVTYTTDVTWLCGILGLALIGVFTWVFDFADAHQEFDDTDDPKEEDE